MLLFPSLWQITKPYQAKPPAVAVPREQAQCAFAGRAKVDRFERSQPIKYQGVTILCADKTKLKIIKKGIDKAVQAGFDLSGVQMCSSSKHDKKLSPGVFGRYLPSTNTILFRYNLDWEAQAAQTAQSYPVWAEKTYAGGPEHLVLHEIGHYLHHQNSERSYQQSFAPFNTIVKAKLTEILGHPYPATNAGEMIAEMFAGKVGGHKAFDIFSEALYKMYKGPQMPIQSALAAPSKKPLRQWA